MYKLAVIGNPIEHSLSPKVFELFAHQFDIKLRYDKIQAHDISEFAKHVTNFFKNGGLALNITSPFKHDAYNLAQLHSTRANFCKSSNFLTTNNSQQIIADTTDGIGIITDIEINHCITINHKKILIIGSGFVLDSILLDFITKNPTCIHILARNHERINFLQNKFAVDTHNFAEEYDIIINTTPNITENELFNQIAIVKDNAFCYDMTYSNPKTIFHQLMYKMNPNIITENGLGMLVEQAKVVFNYLFNKSPSTQTVINSLRIEGNTID